MTSDVARRPQQPAETTTPAGKDNATSGRRRRRHPRAAPYLFLLPFFVIFIPLGAGSVIFAVVMAFLNWPIGGDPTFNGVENFKAVGTDPVFHTALWNTAWMLLAYLLILMPLAIAVAVALTHPRVRGRRWFQMGFFLPITASLVVVAVVFQLLYDSQVGFLDNIFAAWHLPRVPFLTDPSVAPWSIIALRVWRVLGYYAVILYAGMQSISPELYEAASIDGAGAWQRFRSITLPLLRPTTLFVAVAATVGAWELFAEPQLLTNGGPARSTLTAVMYVYQTSFLDFDLGRGAAAAVVLAVCVIATTVLLQRLLRSKT